MPRRAEHALVGAGVALALLFLTWLLAFHVGIFERTDQSIYRGFSDLGQHPRVDRVASFVAQLCNPNPYVYLAGIPVVLALIRRRGWVAVAIVAILLGSNVTAQLLKPLLAVPRADNLLAGYKTVAAASWPSGHATAAMALALCTVLAVPARMRAVAGALGAAFAVAVSYSFLSLGWHYPSDVLGGFLIAAVWTLLGVAALLRARGAQELDAVAGPPASVRRTVTAPAVALLAAFGLVLAVALARPHQVVAYVDAHRAFVIGAGAIGVLALALASALTLALRGPTRSQPSQSDLR